MLERNHVDGLIFLTNHPDDGRLAEIIDRPGASSSPTRTCRSPRAPKLFADNDAGGRLTGVISAPLVTAACSSSAAARR